MTAVVLITGGSGFIGTNLVEHFLQRGSRVVNVDIEPPRNPAHRSVWRPVDLLDAVATEAVLREVRPSLVLHFASRTDLEGATIEDYACAIAGTRNLIEAIDELGRAGSSQLEQVVFASSMLVCPNGYSPRDDLDVRPTTIYGESKVALEQLVRSWTNAPVPWVIVRPTSIWGPWFGDPYRPFFERARRGRFIHPGLRNRTRALGFVGNTVTQIAAIADHREAFASATLYLADYPSYSIGEWGDSIARHSGVRRPLRIPAAVLWPLAFLGDLAKGLGMANPPLTRFRLRNMMVTSRFDTARLETVTGPLPFAMDAGTAATLRWLDEQA